MWKADVMCRKFYVTIIIRTILKEESHDLQLLAPTVFAALRKHKEFFVLLSVSLLNNQPGV